MTPPATPPTNPLGPDTPKTNDVLNHVLQIALGAIGITYIIGFLIHFTYLNRLGLKLAYLDVWKLKYISIALVFMLFPLGIIGPLVALIYFAHTRREKCEEVKCEKKPKLNLSIIFALLIPLIYSVIYVFADPKQFWDKTRMEWVSLGLAIVLFLLLAYLLLRPGCVPDNHTPRPGCVPHKKRWSLLVVILSVNLVFSIFVYVGFAVHDESKIMESYISWMVALILFLGALSWRGRKLVCWVANKADGWSSESTIGRLIDKAKTVIRRLDNRTGRIAGDEPYLIIVIRCFIMATIFLLSANMLLVIPNDESDSLRNRLSEMFLGGGWRVMCYAAFAVMIFWILYEKSTHKDQKDMITFRHMAWVAPMPVVLYICITAYATRVFPYMPASKVGGDFSHSHAVEVMLGRSKTGSAGWEEFQNGSLTNLFQNGVASNKTKPLFVIEEAATLLFVADPSDAGGPMNWRTGKAPPTVYELRRDMITSVIYLTNMPSLKTNTVESVAHATSPPVGQGSVLTNSSAALVPDPVKSP